LDHLFGDVGIRARKAIDTRDVIDDTLRAGLLSKV
jgi:hypothetical protein